MHWVKRIAKKCVRLFLTTLCVFVIFFTYVQQDPWIARTVEYYVDGMMSQLCECQFHADIADIDLLRGSIALKNCAAVPPDNITDWSWYVRSLKMVWSWTDLLIGKKCAVTCAIDGVECYSRYTQQEDAFKVAIVPHLILLCAPPAIDIPFVISGCTLANGFIKVCELSENEPFQMQANLAGEVCTDDQSAHIALRIANSSCSRGATHYLQDGKIKGTVSLPYTFDGDQQMRYGLNASCTVCALPQKLKSLTFQAEGTQHKGVCSVRNEDTSLHGQFIIQNGLDITGKLVIPFLEHHPGITLNYNHAQQTCDVDLPNIVLSQFVQGATSLYNAHAKMSSDAIEISCTSSNNHHAELVCSLKPEVMVKKFQYGDGETALMTCEGTPDSFVGTIPYVTVRRLTQQAGFELQGTGSCNYAGTVLPTGVQVDFDMPDANMRVPMTYSVIQKVSGQLCADWSARSMVVRDGIIDVYKGKVLCSNAKILLDEHGGVRYVHIPLIIQKCFFGWRKDFFAQISGALMVTHTPATAARPEQSRLEGYCMIDQAHVRANPLSAEFQRDFFESALSSLQAGSSSPSGISDNLVCDVSYATKTPLEIKTPFLEGAVVCEGHCTGTLGDPHITGKLEFVRGVLEFPYKPLFITKGSVTLRPEALDDPALNLIARNHIKKYDVELAVTGTVRNPKITFCSSPHLEQANIITLLLGGSEDGSLYFLMPKVMTDTLETLLFGSVETSSRVQKYLKALFHPFKRVSFVPRLSDQAGRGGVRGALSIEVNDRLRAMIEKNVSLPEDTTFEVEYDISDDTSFRVTRDERGDYGLEGEMRWKF